MRLVGYGRREARGRDGASGSTGPIDAQLLVGKSLGVISCPGADEVDLRWCRSRALARETVLVAPVPLAEVDEQARDLRAIDTIAPACLPARLRAVYPWAESPLSSVRRALEGHARIDSEGAPV